MDIKTAPGPIREFLQYMVTIKGRSNNTVLNYYLDLRVFFRYIICSRGLDSFDNFDSVSIDAVDITMVGSVTRMEILDFLYYVSQNRPKFHKSSETPVGNKENALARKISAIKSFYKYHFEKTKSIAANPAADIDSPRIRDNLPKFLTLDESLQLLQSVDGKFQARDYCILTLFLNCGLRVSELAGINIDDIMDDRLRVFGKGSKERIVYLNDACTDAIKDYIPERVSPKPGHKNALFISRLGQRIDVQTVKWLVKKHLRNAGLSSKQCSAHKLRHTAATLMYQNGVDVRTLKEVLGHENLDTTMIYTHVVDSNMKNAAEQNPLSKVQKNK